MAPGLVSEVTVDPRNGTPASNDTTWLLTGPRFGSSTAPSRCVRHFYALGIGPDFATKWCSWMQYRATFFYALDAGLGFVTTGALLSYRSAILLGFYALSFGLGFVTSSSSAPTATGSSFYALGFGQGLAASQQKQDKRR
jgi:hypothetical protein